MTTQQNLSHLDRITQPKAQKIDLNTAALILVCGTSALVSGCQQDDLIRAAREAEETKAAIQKGKEDDRIKSNLLHLQQVDARRPAISIMQHPDDSQLNTSAVSFGIPADTARNLSSQYGEVNTPYKVSVDIPELKASHDVTINPQDGGWVQSLLQTGLSNRVSITDYNTYSNAIKEMEAKLSTASGKSSVRITDGKITATIIIPDAVAHAIKNNKENKVSRDEIADILQASSFPATVVSVSEKTTTDRTSNVSGNSQGNQSNKMSGLGMALGIIIGEADSSGKNSADYSSVTKERSETTSEPNWVNKTHTIDLSQNNALFKFIADATDVSVDNKFDPKEHDKIRKDIQILKATQNRLNGNRLPTDYEAKKYETIVIEQPTNLSEYNNLLPHNNTISPQYVVDTYGHNFAEIQEEIKIAEGKALKNGKIPVVVGVSYPDQIMEARKGDQLFNPSNPDHIKTAMGGSNPFKITVNFAGKVHHIQITPEEFAKKLPEKVVSALQSLANEQAVAR